MIRLAGGDPVPLPLREEQRFAFSAEELADRLTPRTKLVILNSPENPTGGVLGAELKPRSPALARSHRLLVISDEVYSEMLYEGEHVSIAPTAGCSSGRFSSTDSRRPSR